MTRNRTLAVVLVALSPGAPSVVEAADEIHWTLMGQTSVTFGWRGPESQISFGTQSGSYTATATAVTPSPLPPGAGPFWEARLTGLLQNKLYYYRIGTGPEHTFHTPPPRGSSGFWFAEEADIGSTLAYSQVRATQDSIAINEAHVPGGDVPSFVLAVGDLTYGDQNGADDVHPHFNDVMSWSQDAAYMPAWGNHEWDPTGSIRPDQIDSYKGRFDLPNQRRSPGTGTSCIEDDTVPGEDWYWFDYGNVRFIAYPPSESGSCGYVGAEDAWLASADSLMDQVDGDPQIRFVVTFGHHPPHSSGADHGGEPQWAAIMATLRSSHPKYVLNIAGHSHHYERFDPAAHDGLLHIVAPGGGSTLGGLATALPSTVYRINHLQHLKIHVTANRIDGYAVCGPSRPEETDTCVRGTLIDQWSIVSSETTAVGPLPVLPPRPTGWYDLQGRRIDPEPSGVYFSHRGRRVVLR